MQFVLQLSAEAPRRECIRKGEFLVGLYVFITARLTARRYVEMLQRQQKWLIHGLRKLYQRAIRGESWPGDALEPETNGQPLTYDVLTRVGVLREARGFRVRRYPRSLGIYSSDSTLNVPSPQSRSASQLGVSGLSPRRGKLRAPQKRSPALNRIVVA